MILPNFKSFCNREQNIINYEIKNLKGNILTVEGRDILLNSFTLEGSIKNEILNISKFAALTLNGEIEGNALINLLNQKTKAKLILKEINIRLLSKKLQELSIAASGKLSATIKFGESTEHQ